MARIAGKSTDLYIDHLQFDTYANSYSYSVDVNLPEVTAFGDAAATFVEGKANGTFTMNAFFDGTDNKSDEITQDALSGTSEILIAPSGLGNSNIVHELTANLSNKTIDNPVDGATALNVSGQGTSSLARAINLYTPAQTALSATGAVTASRVDTGSTSVVGSLSAGTTKIAKLRITEVSGSGTATIKIQDSSSSGSGYGDYVAFAQFSGVGTQAVTTTDACERYLQINVTQYSGLTNFKCIVTFGVQVSGG
tara:strand:+ start:6764 stop:7519 length:756 start_codon:yes stop_codon:yes gene_type:complete